MLQELLSQIARLFIWVIIVAPWEQALRVRLGSRVMQLEAGWYLVIPFIDRIYRQSIRRRVSVIAPQTLTTCDGHTLCIGGSLGYEIVKLRQLYNTLHDADDTVDSLVAGIIASYIAANSFDACQPKAIQSHVLEQVKLEAFGLGNAEFYITNFARTKTYRFITGEIRGWRMGSGLNTVLCDGQKP